VFRRPELLVAASVPVLLVAGVLPWHRDVVCTQSGCGSVDATAWTGSPVWALVLLVALALAGAWVLALPTRGRVPLAVGALTGVTGVVGAALVVVSLDALVFNRAGFFGFDLPVTETFPVLAVHPGVGLPLGLVGLLLQAVGGWAAVRRHTGLVSSPLSPLARRHARPQGYRAAPTPDHPRTATAFAQGPPRGRHGPPPPDEPRPPSAVGQGPSPGRHGSPLPDEPRPAAFGQGWPSGRHGSPLPDEPRPAAFGQGRPSGRHGSPLPDEPRPAAFGQGWPSGRHGAAAPDEPRPAAAFGQGPPPGRHGAAAPDEPWSAAAFGQGPPARRHRRR
jgi:hypothetical protein